MLLRLNRRQNLSALVRCLHLATYPSRSSTILDSKHQHFWQRNHIKPWCFGYMFDTFLIGNHSKPLNPSFWMFFLTVKPWFWCIFHGKPHGFGMIFPWINSAWSHHRTATWVNPTRGAWRRAPGAAPGLVKNPWKSRGNHGPMLGY